MHEVKTIQLADLRREPVDGTGTKPELDRKDPVGTSDRVASGWLTADGHALIFGTQGDGHAADAIYPPHRARR